MINNKSIRKIKRDVEAISPVVATLMLVLIAVAACTAFYLWESGWQNSTTKTMNNSGALDTSGTLTVSGSTTVAPFAQLAATEFMQNNSGAQITIDSIGSGAGMTAIEQGQCNCRHDFKPDGKR